MNPTKRYQKVFMKYSRRNLTMKYSRRDLTWNYQFPWNAEIFDCNIFKPWKVVEITRKERGTRQFEELPCDLVGNVNVKVNLYR